MSYLSPSSFHYLSHVAQKRNEDKSFERYDRGGVTNEVLYNKSVSHIFLNGSNAGDTWNITFPPHAHDDDEGYVFDTIITLTEDVSADTTTIINFIAPIDTLFGAPVIVNGQTNGSTVAFSGPYSTGYVSFKVGGNREDGYIISQDPHYDITGNMTEGAAVTRTITGGTNISVVGSDPAWTINKDPVTISAGTGISVTGTDPSFTVGLTMPMAMTIGELDFNSDLGSPYALTVTVGGTYYSVAIPIGATTTVTTSGNGVFFDNPTAGQLRYLGANTKKFHMAFSFCFDMQSGTTTTVLLRLKRNGVSTGRIYKQYFAAADDAQTLAFHLVQSFNQGDTISFEATSDTSAEIIRFYQINYVAIGDSEPAL